MKKLYSFGKWNLFSIFAFLVMMAGFQMVALAQSAEDCISGAVPVRTYLFYVTQDNGATYENVSVKNVRDGETLTRPEFVGVEYSTFNSWYTVTDPDVFSAENKFDEGNFSTPQTVTVTDTVRLYASLKADVFHVIFMEGVGSDARVFRVWERVAGTPNLNPDDEQVIVDATTKSVGWYYDQALTQRATTFTMPAHDTTLYPDIKTGKWVYYVSNGGTYVEPDFYQIEETTQMPDNPARVGYTFVGWDNGADAWYRTDGSVDQFGNTLTESITLNAVWTPNEVAYTVVYWVENADDEDYSVNNIRTATALAGDHITTLGNSYTSYVNILDGLNQHVTGFSYDRNTQVSSTDVTVAGDGSTVINLYYKRKSYTLTFNPNRVYNSLLFTSTAFCNWYNLTFCVGTGQTNEVITAKFGANIWDRFPINRFYGQEYGGYASTSMWRATNANVYNYALQTISTMPGSNVTFYLYVNFNVGDDPNMIYYDLENIEGTGFDRKEVPTYFQYITYGEEYCDIQGFRKQTEREAGFNNLHRKYFNAQGQVTLLYYRNSYNLRFFNGGTELTSMAQTRKYEQEIGELASLSDADAPAGKEGFSFGGWYANELCEGDPIDFTSTMPAADIILYAKWVAPEYNVRIHHTTAGVGEYTDVTVPYGQTVSGTDLESIHPCADGANAYGWKILNDDASTSAFATDMQVYRDLALVPFCLLSGEEYTITYNMNCAGAAAVEDDHIYADGANPMVLASSVDECGTSMFLGWVDANNVLYYPGNGIYMTENKTLTALWGSGTEHTELTMVENHPATGTQSVSLNIVTNGTTPLNLPENFERPERPNDLFLGWSTTENATMPEYAPGESVVLSCNVSVYPVWMQIVPMPTTMTLCPGINLDLKDFLAYDVENDAYTFGTADNIQSSTWEVTKDGAEFTDHTNLFVTNIQPGEYVVNLTLTTTKGVEYPLTTTINITGANIDPAFPSLQTTICQGHSVDLPMGSERIPASETSSAIPSVVGAWMYADDFGTIAEVAQVPTENVGDVTITFVPDAGQCANDVSVTFTIVAPPTVSITGESLICDGGSITLTANVDPATSATYQWLEFADMDEFTEITGATGATYDVSAAGAYKVEVTTADGCIVNSGDFEVTAAATPVITVTGETEITYGESVNITVSCANGTLSAPVAAEIPTGLAVDVATNPNELVISGTPDASTYNLVFTGTSDCGDVTETVEITVNPLDVTVTVVGTQNSDVYDGEYHDATGYTITCDNPLYDVNTDVAFSCNAYIARQDVGKDYMTLGETCFQNTNDNFNVTFDVTDGYQEITAAEMTVTVTGATDTKTYTGADFTVAGYTLSCDNPLYDETLVTFTGDDFVTASAIGTHPMGLASDQFSYGNDNIDVTFDVTDGWLEITSPDAVVVTIIGNNTTGDYDGTEHDASGYTVSISNPSYTADDFTFSGTDYVARTDAGTTYMELEGKFENINPAFTDVTFEVTDGYVRINPINVTVTIEGANNTTDYDGELHTVSGYTATADNALYDVNDLTYSGDATAERTDVGTSNMGLEESDFENTNPNFATVTLNITDGYQEITAAMMTVNVTGNTGTEVYTGSEQSVTGYTLACESALYDETLVSYSGTAVASGTNVGTYPMNLAETDFSYNNANINVTFNIVSDGWLLITAPDEVVVTITGHTATAIYDGAVHSANGYDVSISNTLYTESDFTFDGTDNVSATNVGRVEMELANHFHNTNSDFNVTFNVTNGYVSITPRSVTLTSGDATREYNGNVLTNDDVTVGGDGFATGEGATYNVTGEQLLPGSSENAFTYTLNSGTLAGNYTITTVSGTLTVTDRTTPYEVTMTSNSNAAPITYNGLEHSINDFVTHTFTVDGNTYTVSGLAATASGVFAGTYENVISGTAVVTDEYGNDVTGQFTVNTVEGTLTISKRLITFTIENPEDATKVYDGTPLTITFDKLHVDNLAETDQLIGGILTSSSSEVGEYTIEEGNMFYMMATGTFTKSGFKIRHSLYPSMLAKTLASYSASISVSGSITAIDCDGVTYQGHDYPAVLIGTQCWLAENLRNTATAAGSVGYAAYNEEDANADAFGYLYTWYTAVGVAEGDNTAVPATATATSGETYVQGICPDGWAVPSHTDMEILKNYAAGEVRRLRDMSTSYWVGGAEGVTPNYGFNSRGGGFYNSVSGQYERMLLEAYYWESNSEPGTTEVTTLADAYYCGDMLFKTTKKSDKCSVRCIRKVF